MYTMVNTAVVRYAKLGGVKQMLAANIPVMGQKYVNTNATLANIHKGEAR
jgi:hypothetical protein